MRAETITANSRSAYASLPLSPDVALPRERTEESAHRLALLAMRHWERALGGLITVPAAAAMTAGAALLFAVSIAERTFELFERSLAEIPFDTGATGFEAWELGAEVSSGARPRPTRGNTGTWITPGASSGRGTASAAASGGARGRGSMTSGSTSRSRPIATGPARVTANDVAAARGTVAGGTSASGSSAGETSSPDERGGRTRAAGESAQTAAKVEDAWDVVLVEAGDNPIALVREIRELTGKELRDVELLVNAVPGAVTHAITRVEAEVWRTRIEGAGGRVEVRRA